MTGDGSARCEGKIVPILALGGEVCLRWRCHDCYDAVREKRGERAGVHRQESLTLCVSSLLYVTYAPAIVSPPSSSIIQHTRTAHVRVLA